MAVSVSGVVLFGVLLGLSMWMGRLRLGGALIAVLFGFCLASTGIAPAIHGGLTAIGSGLSHL
jgi:hypothetical protein